MRRRSRDLGASGALLPGYTSLEELGRGTSATVFRAVETETGRTVALKILDVDTVHSRLLEAYRQEIQVFAAVSDHPNIVTLYRPATTSDGRPALVLELCRESLDEQLRRSGPMSAAEVTRVGIRIAGALETAHREGILHRHVKPQSILVTRFGDAVLGGFGVAALQPTAGVFGSATVHAAPEILEGHQLVPATDIYGLASTMYQLLTGRALFAPFDNEAPASAILRVLRDPVRPLRADDIPLDLADLLESALSKQPGGRPASALEFARALQRVEHAQGWPQTPFVTRGEGASLPPHPPHPVPGGGPTPGGWTGRGPMGVTLGGSPDRVDAPRSAFVDPDPAVPSPAVAGDRAVPGWATGALAVAVLVVVAAILLLAGVI